MKQIPLMRKNIILILRVVAPFTSSNQQICISIVFVSDSHAAVHGQSVEAASRPDQRGDRAAARPATATRSGQDAAELPPRNVPGLRVHTQGELFARYDRRENISLLVSYSSL